MRFYLIFGMVTFHFVNHSAISQEATSEKTSSTTPAADDYVDSTTIPGTTFLTATASKLVSYRKLPQQVKFVRKIAYSSKRPKSRHRIKRPRVKYNHPTYSTYSEPLNFYKPTKYSIKNPSPLLSYDDLKDFDFNIKDFELSSSSYETDCDSFKESSCYRQSKKPKIQYSSYHKKPNTWRQHGSYDTSDGYDLTQSTDSHEDEYLPNDSSYFASYPSFEEGYHKEDSKYRYAPEKISDSSHVHGLEESPTSYEQFPPYIPKEHHHDYRPYTPPPAPSYSDYKPAVPNHSYSPSSQSSYEDLSLSAHHSSYLPPPLPTEAPPVQHSYDSYDTYKTEYHNDNANGGYKENQHHFAEPPSTKTDVEITYSPSYEIYPQPSPSSSENSYRDKAVSQEHRPSSGNFAEPPTQFHHGNNGYFPSQPYDLPLDQNSNTLPYGRPKNSYEVPIYDPTPFSPTPDKQNEYLYPPHPFEQTSFDKHHLHEEQSYDTTNQVESISVPYETNKAHRDNFKNSSYEESSDASQEPPSSEYIDYLTTTSSKSSNSYRPRQKRKRIRVITSRKKIHNLDTPELEHAFESTNAADPLVDETKTIQEKQNRLSTITAKPQETRQVTTAFSNKKSWNPMKLRTSSRTVSTKTTPSSIANDKRSGQKSTTATTKVSNTLRNISILSIQKSKSHNFYDGTVAPDKIVSQTENLLRRSTKSVLNTTYFKNPKNNAKNLGTTIRTAYFQENLPKNHKYF